MNYTSRLALDLLSALRKKKCGKSSGKNVNKRCESVSLCQRATFEINYPSLPVQRRWQKQQSALVSVVNRARGLGLVLKKGDAARFKAAGSV